MDLSPLRRRSVALVAGYAMALQMLFAAFVPLSLATTADGFVVLCSHDANGSAPPAQHDLPCAAMCAAMAQSISGPLPTIIAVGVVARPSIAALSPATNWGLPRFPETGSHAPRGPQLV